MSQPYKSCPQCRSPADLQAPRCQQCGHVYRTQFAPAAAPPDQTQAVDWPPPAPRPRGLPVLAWAGLCGCALPLLLLTVMAFVGMVTQHDQPLKVHRSEIISYQPGAAEAIIVCPMCKGAGTRPEGILRTVVVCRTCGGRGAMRVHLSHGLQIIPDEADGSSAAVEIEWDVTSGPTSAGGVRNRSSETLSGVSMTVNGTQATWIRDAEEVGVRSDIPPGAWAGFDVTPGNHSIPADVVVTDASGRRIPCVTQSRRQP